MRLLFLFILIFPYSLVAQAWTPLDSVHINSGNPKFPFPQFLPYQNGTLGNLATHSGVGVTHAEMEQTIRDAYRIMMNRAHYDTTHTILHGVKYIKFESSPDCSEGDGYGLLGAAAMADKTTFDGLWLWIHDNALNKDTSYSTGQPSTPYIYSSLVGVWNKTGGNSATDGDVDIALALYTAYMQWGELMGISDSKGNPISYKHDLIQFLKGLTDTIPFASNPTMLICGDIGMDGYIKGGDTWTELTNWANNTAQTGYSKAPNFGGPQTEWIDYSAPSYFHEFANFLSNENPSLYAWNISQFQRCEASSDWLMGQLYNANQSNIPYAGQVSMTNNVPTFNTANQGEDFRLSWRTILNYIWHGNPTSTWDPVAHQVKTGTANSFEHDIGARYGKFLWDNTHQLPWTNSCTGVTGPPVYSYWGPSIIGWLYSTTGTSTAGEFFLNWVPGTGSPSAVIGQNYDLMAELYRYLEIEWDVDYAGDGYITSVPHYFHEWFRLMGMLTLTGNYHPPSIFQQTSNMKVYMAINKTFGFQNDSVTYTIDYRNYGSKDAVGVTIIDTLPKDFIFLSATGGGACNNATNIVTWNIGAVPGFQTTTGIKPTTGEVVLKIKVGNPTLPQYRNRATIFCSNGSGWTSNEYPNDTTSVMERNFLDIAKRALVVHNVASVTSPKAGTPVQFTINYKNTSDAGWINGGRPGVHFSFSQSTGSSNPGIASMNTMRFRLFHDADESYIDYGNYRVSYFLYDTVNTCADGINGCTTGWNKMQTITEGIKDPTTVKLLQEMITPGQDSLGKWNQRIVVQFSDPTNPNRIHNLATIDHHLLTYAGEIGSRIHKGGGMMLRLVWQINGNGWLPINWGAGWSWDANGSDPAGDGGKYFPITNDWTDLDNPNIPVTTWNPKNCETATHFIKNVLVEEWDGYTWRRVAGNGPLPGRDVNNVVITDTIPIGLTLNSQTVTTPPGFTQAISGNVITWTKPKMQVNDSGTITFYATASCPPRGNLIINRAWISGLNESPVTDNGARLTLACNSNSTMSKLTLTDPSSNIVPSGDTARIDTTAFFITVKDSDQNVNNNARDTITALVGNPSSGDSLTVKLIETGNATGVFQSATTITVVSLPAGQRGPNQISAGGGETIYITYTDQYDSTDISQAHLVTLATFPVPVYGWIFDANGDGRADSAVVLFSQTLTTAPDSVRFYFPDQTTFQTIKAGQGTMQINGRNLSVKFPAPFATAVTSFTSGGSGSGYSYTTNNGTVRKFQFTLADSIGPILTSAQVVERAPGAFIDTLYVTFSEAVAPASLKGASLILIQNGTPTTISIDSARKVIATRFALSLASGTPQPQPGDMLRINPAGPIQDLYGNKANALNPAVAITLKQSPPTIIKAYYVDRSFGLADGYVDTAIIRFNKKVSLSDLSFQLDWGTSFNVGNISGDTIAYTGPDSTGVGIALRTVYPYTGLPKTSGNMFVTASFISFPGETRQAQVSDSAAPVIDSATYVANTLTSGGCDSLRVVFSEPVNINQALNPFLLSGKSSPSYTFNLTPTAIGGNTAVYCVSGASAKGLPMSGDVIWIAPNNSVGDLGGVFQNNGSNRKVVLTIVRPKTDWKPSVACNPLTPGPGFMCMAVNGGVLGTAVVIKPAIASQTLPSMTLRLQVFDLLGSIVYENQNAQSGADGNSYYFVWDGRNKSGRFVGTGVYRGVVTAIDESGTSSKAVTIGVKR